MTKRQPTFQVDNCEPQGSRIHLGFWTLEDGAERLSRNVGKELALAQKGAVLIYFVAKAWNLAFQVFNSST